jgi:hypothetical protein
VRVTHAQPLVPSADDSRLEPQPLLTAMEAELEAFVLNREGGEMYTLVPLDDVPATLLSETAEERRCAGELNLYTHWLSIVRGPSYGCPDYLVRVE